MAILNRSLLAVLPALAALVWLGTWQLERMAWKEALIADVEARTELAPVALPPMADWGGLDLAGWRYRPVTAVGRFALGRDVLAFTTLGEPRGLRGGPGYWVLTPFEPAGGGTVLVNRGFVPDEARDGAAPPPEGEVRIWGLVREGAPAGLFTPPPDAAGRIVYSRDIAAIAALAGVASPAPFIVDARAGAPGELPQGGETTVEFRNDHLGYAVTWYGLAAALVVVYVAFLRGRARGPRFPDP